MEDKKILESGRIEKLAALFLVCAAVFVGAKAIEAALGLFDPRPMHGNSISVSGEGRVIAVPDIATISFSVNEEAATIAAAQEVATQKINEALSALRNSVGIEDRDIRTTSYNAYPRYSYTPCFDRICPPVTERIIGYTVSQSVEVKVRDIEQVGAVLAALGSAGVANLSGPSFTVDDMESLKREARDKAVKDAHEKARAVSKSLGVRLVRVIGYWENTDGYYYPQYRMEGFGGADMATPSAMPELPLGENEIVINLSVSYEIR